MASKNFEKKVQIMVAVLLVGATESSQMVRVRFMRVFKCVFIGVPFVASYLLLFFLLARAAACIHSFLLLVSPCS